jgi:hypothetical protein
MVRRRVSILLAIGLALVCTSCSHHRDKKNCYVNNTANARKASGATTQKGSNWLSGNQKPATRARLFMGKQPSTGKWVPKPNNIQSSNPLNGCRSDAWPVEPVLPMRDEASAWRRDATI